MPKYIVVELSENQATELETVRHQHPKAFMRERAAAVLKVAQGETVTAVAEKGLLTRHEPETVHQWIKNVLIFIPAILAMRIVELEVLLKLVVALPLLGLMASGTYILNDLLDLQADRAHRSQLKRP